MTRQIAWDGADLPKEINRDGADLSREEISGSLRELGHVAKAEINRRRQRYRFFPKDLFGEPNWDILLDAYVAYAEGRQISVSNSCIAANVPSTTALRYLGKLMDKGLLRIRKSESDRRVSFVSLTDTGIFVMEQYLKSQSSAFHFSG